TGCVLVDDAATSDASFALKPLGLASAAAFRGRCHGPLAPDHDDNPCIPDGTKCCLPPSGCNSCKSGQGGAPNYFVSEPFLNLWISDTPLQYTPAYGPPVWVVLAYNERRERNGVSDAMSHGAMFGTYASYYEG